MNLRGQTVVIIGGSAGIGLETARRARDEAADVVLTGRNPDRLAQAAKEVDAVTTAAFDATDAALLAEFFRDLERPIDHVMVSGSGPYYAALADLDFEEARRDVENHLFVRSESHARWGTRSGQEEASCSSAVRAGAEGRWASPSSRR